MQTANVAMNRRDIEWVLTLFGTAVGAGILFLPIQAGLGGIWPMLILTVLIFPVTWLAHRALTRLVVSSDKPADITAVIESDLGRTAGFMVSILYFLSIVTIVVGYATGVTNIVSSFLENQLGITGMSRSLLCMGLLIGLTAVLAAGENVMLRVTSLMVFPLIAFLFALSVYLIPSWNMSAFDTPVVAGDLVKNLLLTLPILVFSMNFSPICSALGMSYRERHPKGDEARQRTDKIVFWNAVILLVFVMFFVFSSVLATSPADLANAKANNVDVLTMISLQTENPFLRYAIPFVAFAAIVSSYFGHFIGTREGLLGIITRLLTWNEPARAAQLNQKKISLITTVLMVIGLWVLAVVNPPILKIIGALSAPIIAMYCYIMPVVLMRRVPRLAIYREKSSALVFVLGLVVIVGYTLAELM